MPFVVLSLREVHNPHFAAYKPFIPHVASGTVGGVERVVKGRTGAFSICKNPKITSKH